MATIHCEKCGLGLEAVAPGVHRCPVCKTYADSAGDLLDPQPRVLLDMAGDDEPDPGWQHVVFAVTVRARPWIDPTELGERVSAYFEHGSHREGIYVCTEDLIDVDDAVPSEFDPDGAVIETWGHRVIGVQYAPHPEHDRLLDHYAQLQHGLEPEDGLSYHQLREQLDVTPSMQGLLGRNGNWEGACKIAGIPPYLENPIIPMVDS